ncbi:MAG: hypothetical protein MZV63_08280 [Marinilabiliales bacterium]|nr:hypothetical protein [Marinilabiliales bacterium]
MTRIRTFSGTGARLTAPGQTRVLPRKVRNEREKFYSKIKQLESDIVLWENNIGFFAKSANADTMIREVQEKIADAHRNIKILEEKVKLIDSSMYEE